MKPRRANFLRMLLGVALFPFCWAIAVVLFDSIVKAAGASGGVTLESFSLLAGMAAFSLSWMALAHPVKMYILGHELTHALWGVLFGAKPSKLRVGASGGSVNLTKSNVFITLAPYFFPFYTFVVVVAALLLSFFVEPLPCLPLWMFMIGFTWAFHVLFTCETLTRRQPDVGLYGRIFSWVFIFIVNVSVVLVWLALTTSLELAEVFSWTWSRACDAYGAVYGVVKASVSWLWGLFF